ncbi:MAG: alcohol dehydrogenase catalytic domain-containing protein [Planctomycetales bacterium]|nr:alcohol dehydrogenase catalytic domain-containing protein [Planctomycetales bacterium]
MRALVRTVSGTLWAEVPEPQLQPDGVLIHVALVGLCRTDLAVAAGDLPVTLPRILGHEFVGRVIDVGPEVQTIAVGDKVVADPVIRCGRCERCLGGWHHACKEAKFLGVDIDGAIAQWIAVPECNLWRFPIDTDDRVAALLEPVAACAAVVSPSIHPDQRGVIYGSSRLSRLTHMILRSYGFRNLQCVAADSGVFACDQFEFAIDTEGTTESFERLCESLRPRGELILKSRPLQPISFDVRHRLPKEPTIRFVNYSDFSEARRLLLETEIDFQSLLGPVWMPDDFARALESAAVDQYRKHYIQPTAVDDCQQGSATEMQCVP